MSPNKNPALALCELAKPYLLEGSRLFTSKSVLVAVHTNAPLEEQIYDVELTIRLLTVLASKLKEGVL
jgi:hypothetical protein